MNDDAALLREYAGNRSEQAFTELVRRHVDLVYATALRRTDGNPHLAADVAQQVFTELARRAGQLAHYAVLEAWLHTATRNAAINLMISEKRRRVRETAAVTAAADTAPAGAVPDWDRVRPLLDTAIDELPEQDRTAVVLRFLERKSFAAIGAALRVSEDAARMRTDRALDKLRAGLARRGFTSSATALAGLVAGQPLVSAPTGLAALLASQALAPAASGLAAPTVFALMNAKLVTTAAVVAAVFFLLGRYSFPMPEMSPPAPAVFAASAQTDDSQQTIAQLRRENAELRADVDRLTDAARDLLAKLAAPPPVTAVVVQQREAMLSNLRKLAASADQFALQNRRLPASLDDVVGPNRYLKELNVINGEDYSQLSFSAEDLVLTLADGATVSYHVGTRPVFRESGGVREGGGEAAPVLAKDAAMAMDAAMARSMALRRRVRPAEDRAIQAYIAANGRAPAGPEDLAPYFENPQDAADLAESVRLARDATALRR